MAPRRSPRSASIDPGSWPHPKRGAGLGLAIVKRLVALGGGQVGAESGSERMRFWFSLPA